MAISVHKKGVEENPRYEIATDGRIIGSFRFDSDQPSIIDPRLSVISDLNLRDRVDYEQVAGLAALIKFRDKRLVGVAMQGKAVAGLDSVLSGLGDRFASDEGALMKQALDAVFNAAGEARRALTCGVQDHAALAAQLRAVAETVGALDAGARTENQALHVRYDQQMCIAPGKMAAKLNRIADGVELAGKALNGQMQVVHAGHGR
jgi:hypothetical protein